MTSNYKKLGPYIEQVNIRNNDLGVDLLLGVSIQKIFIPSIANTVGTNMKTYKIIRNSQFAYGPVTSRNGDKVSIALLEDYNEAIVSQAYTVFRIIQPEALLPEYLMMWFRRPEFDRYARFKSHGSARETFDWDELCEVELPIPSREKQQEIVNDYNTVVNRIKLNEELNTKLEVTAQTIYKHWFVDFECPMSKEYAESIGEPELEGQPYKSSGGEMVINEELGQEIPAGWTFSSISEFVTTQYGYTASADFFNVGPKFLRITDIANGSIDWKEVPNCNISEKDFKKYSLEEGDILIARTGASVGAAKRINKNSPPAVFASYLVRIKPVEKIWDLYMALTITSEKYREYILGVAGGSAQPQANAVLMTEYKILIPNKEVLELFNKLIIAITDFIEVQESEISQLQVLKKLILTSLVTSTMEKVLE